MNKGIEYEGKVTGDKIDLHRALVVMAVNDEGHLEVNIRNGLPNEDLIDLAKEFTRVVENQIETNKLTEKVAA